MRRGLAILIGLILIVAAIITLIIAAGSKNNADKKSSVNSLTSTERKEAAAVKPACKIFTLADAKQLLGDTAKGGQNSISNTSEDIEVSTCTYSQDQGSNTPVSTNKSATLLVRSPKTNKGIASNQSQFGVLKPAGVQDVDDYGDKAFWSAEHGQLNILKNNIWYILSYGPVTPAERSLDQTKQMADILIDKM